MTLEQAIEYLRNFCSGLSENIECNQCRGDHMELLGFLVELSEWREDPLKKIKETCENSGKCIECSLFDKGCAECFDKTPEDWKL